METKRRRRWLKVLLITTGILVVLLIALVATVHLWIDPVAKHAIEVAGTSALGVTTTLDEINIHVFRGEATLRGLNIANPPGYEAEHFLDLGHGSVAVSLKSLGSDTVNVPTLLIEDLHVNLEKNKDGYNYEKILKNLESEPAPEEQKDAGPGKSFLIREVVIRNVAVRYDVNLAVTAPTVRVTIAEKRYENVGQDHKVTLSEVMGILLKSVLRSIAEAGGDLPGDVVQGLGKGVGAVGKTVGKAATGAAKGVGGAAKGVGDAVGGLFGGKKKKDEEKKDDK